MKLIYSSLLMVLFAVANAQEIKELPNETNSGETKTYDSSKSNLSSGRDETKAKNKNSYKWIVKTDPVAFFIEEEVPLIFECKIAKRISLEASVGITYPFLTLREAKDNESSTMNYLQKEEDTDMSYRFSAKYYPQFKSELRTAIEGVYFGLQVFKKNLKLSYYQEPLQEMYKAGEVKTNADLTTEIGATALAGVQVFSSANGGGEVFIGLGAANSTHEYLSDKQEDLYAFKSESKMKFVFQFGVRIGLGN